MPRDPLEAVLRIRRMAVDTARRHLAEALTIEETARRHAEAAEARIVSEGQAAADIATGDSAVEAFAAWLPVGRAEAQTARVAHDKAVTDVNMARAAVTVARAAAEAAADLQLRRKADQALLAERRAQNALDEVASRAGAAERDPS